LRRGLPRPRIRTYSDLPLHEAEADVAVASVYLRQTLNLIFFDSHYAAAALNLDRRIISFDQSYDRVNGLTRVDPATI